MLMFPPKLRIIDRGLGTVQLDKTVRRKTPSLNIRSMVIQLPLSFKPGTLTGLSCLDLAHPVVECSKRDFAPSRC